MENILAFEAHRTTYSDEVSVAFVDNNKTPLIADGVFDMVSQYIGCAHFSIELQIIGESTKTITFEVG